MADAVDSISLVDQWTREDPVSEGYLQHMRIGAVRELVQDGLVDEPETFKYTCDACDRRYVCKLVFDAYNTNGDCIWVK